MPTLTPQSIQNLFLQNGTLPPLNKYREACIETGLDDPATVSVGRWEDFKNKFPEPFKLITLLHVLNIIDATQYTDILRNADLVDQAQPFAKLLPLPQAVVPRPLQNTHEQIQQALVAPPASGRTQQIKEERDKLRIRIAKRQAAKIPIQQGSPPSGVKNKIEVLSSGRLIPSTEMDTLEVSTSYFDNKGNFDAYQYTADKKKHPEKIAALEQTLAREIEQKATQTNLSRTITAAIEARLAEQYGAVPSRTELKTAAEEIAKRVSSTVVGAKAAYQTPEAPLQKVDSSTSAYILSRVENDPLIRSIIQTEMSRYLADNDITDPQNHLTEHDELTARYAGYVRSAMTQAASNSPEVIISTRVNSQGASDPHQRGLLIDVKTLNSSGVKINAELETLFARQNATFSTAQPSALRNQRITQAYHHAQQQAKVQATGIATRKAFDKYHDRTFANDIALAQRAADGLAAEELAFRQNPYWWYMTAHVRLPFYTFAPKPIVKAYENARDTITGQKAELATMPYLDSGAWMQGLISSSLGHLTGWIDVHPTGRISLGPAKWMNVGMRSFARRPSLGFGKWTMLDHEGKLINRKSYIRSLGLGRHRGEAMLNLDTKTNRKFKRNKALNRYAIGETSFIAAFLSFTVGAWISSATVWALEKVGLMKHIREMQQMTRQISAAWTSGGGICTEGYKDLAMMQWNAGSKFQGGIMRGLSVAGRSGAFKVLRGGLTIGKVAATSAFKAIGIYMIGTMLLGATPAAMGAIAGIYGGYKIVDGMLKPNWFTHKYIGQFTSTGWEALPHQTAAFTNANNSLFGRMVRGWNTPIVAQFGKSEFGLFGEFSHVGMSGLQKGIITVFRNLPIDGFIWTLALSQLGVPLGWALVPVGIDLGIKGYMAFRGGLGNTPFGRLMGAPFAIITLPFDFFTGYLALHEAGGFLGFLQHLRLEGFTISNLLRSLGILSPGLATAGLVSVLIGGAVSWAAVGVISVFFVGVTAGVILVDFLTRFLFNKSFFELIFPPIKKFIARLGGNLGRGMAGIGSAVLGLIGLIQSLMRGDPIGISLSLAFMLLGGTFLISKQPSSSYLASYHTPATGGALTTVIENTYIKSASKEKVSIDTSSINNPSITYEISYNIEMSDADAIQITETDKFDIAGTAIQEVSGDFDSITNNNRTLTRSLPFSQSESIKYEFSVTLSQSLATLLPNEDDYLCNTLTIDLDSVTKERVSDTSPDEPQVIIPNYCIDKDGEVVQMTGHLTVLPVEINQGSVTSCYGYRTIPKPGFHRGIDIGTNIQDADGPYPPLRAAGDGTVEVAEWITKSSEYANMYYGLANMVRINHGNNIWTIYGHMSSLSVSVGDNVKAGDIIGTVGSTGNSTGPHVHFGTYKCISSYSTCAYDPCEETGLDFNSYPGADCCN